MDKRKFLKGLITGAVALSAASLSAAGITDDRYVRLVKQQEELIELNRSLHDPSQPWAVKSAAFTPGFANLLRTLHYDFDGTAELAEEWDTMLSKTSRIFRGELNIDTLSTDELRQHENCIVCIAVMRHLLAKERMVFDPSKCTHWRTFADRYADVIIAA